MVIETLNKKKNYRKLPKDFVFDLNKTNLNLIELKKGDFVYKEGVSPKGLYYIKSGSVEIFKELPDGKKLSLRIAREGEFIGYKDLIIDSRYSSYAIVKEDSTFYFIKKKDFNDMLKSTDISRYFLRLTSADYHALENDFMSVMSQKSVEGNDTKENNHFDRISLSIDELLNLIGTSVNSFIKILSNLNNENVLSVKGKVLTMQEDNRLAVIRHIQNQILTRTELL